MGYKSLTIYSEKKNKKERIERNKHSIQSMIDILQEERGRFKRIMDDEAQKEAIKKDAKNLELQEKAIAEQKKGNRIMTWTLWATAIGIIISIVMEICK